MKVLIVCSGNPEKGISPLVKSQVDSFESFNDVEFVIFPIEKHGLIGYLSVVPELHKKAGKYKPDIIHAHYGLSGFITFLSRLRCKSIISFMGDDLLGSIGKHNRYTVFSKILVLINKMLARYYFDFSIVKSEELFRILKKSENIMILPNGVDIERFAPFQKIDCRTKLGINKDDKIVLFVSDPSRPEKNYALAEKAIALLKKDEVKLISVYSLDQNKLVYYYNSADVLLMTSFHEGSPNVIKEAMASCCPIVTTKVGDVSYVLGNTPGCYIVDPDPESVSQGILKAINFRNLFFFTNGRERVIELKLDSFSVAGKLREIYCNIAG